MSEIISINLGQGGVQLGNNCWEIFCHEHNIQPNGELNNDQNNHLFNPNNEIKNNIFFSQNQDEKYVPRSLFIDLDPESIDDIRCSAYRNLYDSKYYIQGKEDTAYNFARGRYTLGPQYIDLALEKIRQLSEDCENLQGFMIYNSVGGGTGTGLGSLLLEKIQSEYGKKQVLQNAIYPSYKRQQVSESVLEPYNSVLYLPHLLKNANTVLPFENEAISDILNYYLDVDKPKYRNINFIAAYTIASITIPIRFNGVTNDSLAEINKNHIPYPTLNHLCTSCSPYYSRHRTCGGQQTVKDIMEDVLQRPKNCNVKCDLQYGQYMAGSFFFKGDTSPKDINNEIYSIINNKTANFVDWVPSGFKASIEYMMPTFLYQSDNGKQIREVTLLANNTSIKELFQKTKDNFEIMYLKKAFLHWFLKEGMEEQELQESLQEIESLLQDYQEVEQQYIDDDQPEDNQDEDVSENIEQQQNEQ